MFTSKIAKSNKELVSVDAARLYDVRKITQRNRIKRNNNENTSKIKIVLTKSKPNHTQN